MTLEAERKQAPPPASGFAEVECATASMRTGALLDEAAREHPKLEGLAATLPDLFGTVDTSCLDRIAQRLGGDASGHTFAEILVLSEQHVHVIQPLTRRPGVAFLAVSAADSSVGLVLSAVRVQVAALEEG